IRSGRIAAHVPDAQKPAAQRLLSILQTLSDGRQRPVAPAGAGSFALDGSWLDEDLAAQGYLRFGKRAVRADLAERLGWELSKRRKEAGQPVFEIPPDLASIVSCPLDDFHSVLKGFNIAPAEKDPETGAVKRWRFQSKAVLEARREQRAARKQSKPGKRPASSESGNGAREHTNGKRPPRAHGKKAHSDRRARPQRQPDPNSPFAALAALLPPEPAKPNKPKKKRRAKKSAPLKATQSTEEATAPKDQANAARTDIASTAEAGVLPKPEASPPAPSDG
ncbi:MAG: helicase, partial [Pseudomonadota bacterium]